MLLYFYLGGVDIFLLSNSVRVLRVKHHIGITHFLHGKTVTNNINNINTINNTNINTNNTINNINANI